MVIKSLSHSSFDAIVDCFQSAFQNYFVPMPTDKTYYQTRWKAAKVNFDLSFGMYDGEQLVGFIIHAIDLRNKHLTAYNTGTGVLENYRGRSIIKEIYSHAIPILQERGVTRSILEVIQENERAIHVYKNVGFKIIKEYKCFNGAISLNKKNELKTRRTDVKIIEHQRMETRSKYSWDNQLESIENAEYEYYEIMQNGKAESYFVIHPTNGYIPQLDCYHSTPKAWENLAHGIRQISSKAKINNVDLRFKDKLGCIDLLGVENVVDQYEMELILDAQ